jgi:hypothetical protein
MSDQQGTSKAARGLLITKITHVKLETATRAYATPSGTPILHAAREKS